MRFKTGDIVTLMVAGGADTYAHVHRSVRVEAIGPFTKGTLARIGSVLQVPGKDGDYVVRLTNRVLVVVSDWQLAPTVASIEPSVMNSRAVYEAKLRS